MRQRRFFLTLIAVALATVPNLAPQSHIQQKIGKLTKLTDTEIDIDCFDQGQTVTFVFVLAPEAKSSPASLGETVNVTFYLDEKGQKVAKSFTVYVRTPNPSAPGAGKNIEPSAVSEAEPAPAPKPGIPSETAADTSGTETAEAASPAEHTSTSDTTLTANGSFGTAARRKPRIAILDFDYSTVQTASTAIFGTNVNLGKGMADLLATDLAKAGVYTIIEPSALDKVMAEQNFSNSNRLDSASAAKIGKLLGVDAIVVGSISEFGNVTKITNVGGSGSVGHSKNKANVAVTARIIDVKTGEVVGVADGEGTSARPSSSTTSAFESHLSDSGSLDFGSSNFRQTIIGEAVKSAVDSLSAKLNANAPKINPHAIEVEGIVAAVEGNQIVLNVGSKAGIKVGDQFNVLRVTKEIKDPATGSVIRRLSDSIGLVKVTDVDDLSAICAPISGSGFKTGDTVKTATQ